ncbi:hypothetical protein GCM10009612_35620 [Streptomyces beijiangensis]
MVGKDIRVSRLLEVIRGQQVETPTGQQKGPGPEDGSQYRGHTRCAQGSSLHSTVSQDLSNATSAPIDDNRATEKSTLRPVRGATVLLRRRAGEARNAQVP